MKYNSISEGIMEKLPSVPDFPIGDRQLKHAFFFPKALWLWVTLDRGWVRSLDGLRQAGCARAWHGHQHFVLHIKLCPVQMLPQTSGLRSQVRGHQIPFMNNTRAESWWLRLLITATDLGTVLAKLPVFIRSIYKTGVTAAQTVLLSLAEIWWCANIRERGV